MLRIIFFVMAMALLALADGPVLQTGQTKSYDVDGNVVAYSSIKDDGYFRAGKARSYSRSGYIVIDNTTSLQWQDNESIQKPWVTQANYDDGNYSDTSGDTATTYCKELFLGEYGDWRLPSIEELKTLIDYSKHPTVTEGVFSHIVADFYWSATDSGYFSPSGAWANSFNMGDNIAFNKSAIYYVRCVRGGQLSSPNLSRDAVDEIVTDSNTGLQWQDDVAAKSTNQLWEGAIGYCENTLTLGGYDDWRLPNINELISIMDFSREDPSLDNSVFKNYSSSTYWSSTTYAGVGHIKAWTVFFRDGYTFHDFKFSTPLVRCVRGGQVNIPVNPSIIMYLLY